MTISVILNALTFHQGQTFRSSRERGCPAGSNPSEASGSSCEMRAEEGGGRGGRGVRGVGEREEEGGEGGGGGR